MVVSLALGSAVAAASAKGIATLVWLLIYRFVALIYSIPLGNWSAARSINDDGSLLKIWFREWVSVCMSLFIIAFGYVIMKYTVATLSTGLENGEISIDGITNVTNAIFTNILIILISIILIYANNTVIVKTIEIFASSGVARDNVNNEIVNEYRRAQSSRSSVKNNISKSSKKITSGTKTFGKDAKVAGSKVKSWWNNRKAKGASA